MLNDSQSFMSRNVALTDRHVLQVLHIFVPYPFKNVDTNVPKKRDVSLSALPKFSQLSSIHCRVRPCSSMRRGYPHPSACLQMRRVCLQSATSDHYVMNHVIVKSRRGQGPYSHNTAPPPPGISLTVSKSHLQGHVAAAGFPRFFYILATNKVKNPHAPTLVSKFNPLPELGPPKVYF